MTWHRGLFLDVEDAAEVRSDPYRCSWCSRPFDPTRMHDLRAPEVLVFEGALRMRAEGSRLEDVLHAVELAWQHEEH